MNPKFPAPLINHLKRVCEIKGRRGRHIPPPPLLGGRRIGYIRYGTKRLPLCKIIILGEKMMPQLIFSTLTPTPPGPNLPHGGRVKNVETPPPSFLC